MDLNYLMYFRKVAELQNITKAAEQLSITQPALSRVIHNIENEIGYKLFDRSGKNIVINKKGEMFLDFADDTLSAYERVKSDIKDVEMKEKKSINLSMRTSLCILPVLIKGFQEVRPDITLNVERKLSEENEDADVIIDTSLTPGDGENVVTLVEEDSKLLISKQLLKDYPPDVSLKDFSKETFFVLRGSVQKDITIMACKNAGFTPKVSTDFISSVTIHSFLETGLGVSIVPEKLWNYTAHPGLRMMDIPIMACKKYMIMKCNSSTSENVQAFKEFCIDFFEKLESDGCVNYFESDMLKGSKINE